MVITIYEGYDKSYVLLGSKDERFAKNYGSVMRVFTNNLYRELADISAWINNDLEEECLFEID